MRNRYWPTAFVILAMFVLGWYLLYTELLMREMRRDALVHSSMTFQILRGLSDPREESANQTLLSLVEQVHHLGIPIVVADPEGEPAWVSKLTLPGGPERPARSGTTVCVHVGAGAA
jgi:hypothetical protein